MTEKTDWRKNLDSRYISGEDLHGELNGLKREQVVVISRFEDAETFDQNKQEKSVKTGFYLSDLNGRGLYKPVILNKTNAKFCEKEFNSRFMEDWLNLPFVLYAMPDKRFGFVARFKKYNPPPKTTDKRALELLKLCDTKEKLSDCWLNVLTIEERNFPTVIAEKERMKTVFEVKV